MKVHVLSVNYFVLIGDRAVVVPVWSLSDEMIYAFMIYIGQHIEKELHKQNKTVTWFARQLGCSRTNVYKIFAKKAIDTDSLVQISRILTFDFFALYTEELTK